MRIVYKVSNKLVKLISNKRLMEVNKMATEDKIALSLGIGLNLIIVTIAFIGLIVYGA